MSDPLQFEVFMRNYQNMVYGIACRLLADEAEAQDIAQEVFLRAYNHFEELRESPTVGGWLKTVTRNLCLSHITRRRSRWKLFSEFKREGDEGGERDYADTLEAPDTLTPALDTADQQALLAKSLEELPDAQRVPLVLYHFDDLSYEEIARQLNISLSKVKVDIHRGRQALRRKLSRHTELQLS